MFRIKTDIRQYKCETKDKVEKLIRNWVIRPSDLIYNRDEKEWLPIGEHPSFIGLFGMLAEQEQNTPDTVVTARNPYADGKKPVDGSPVGPGNIISEASEDGDNGEVTHMIARPAFDDSEAADDESDDEEVVEALADAEQRETDEVEATERDDVEEPDVRETDVFEQEDIAETMGGKPGPPEAPVGVEPPSSGEEVTMMTEKTLEMLKVTDEDEAAEETSDTDGEESEPETADETEDEEETTNVIESPLEDEDEGEEEEKEEDDESDDAADDDEHEGPEEAAEGDEEPEEEGAKQPRLGRHDLPEELFATNEISSPEVQEKMKTLDDLGELSGGSDAEEVDENEDDGKTPRWGSKLNEDSGIDEAWAVIEDEFPSEVDEDAALRTTDELDRDTSDPEDEDWDEDEWEEEWEGDTPEPEVVQVRDFVSDGYKMPMPFPIRPTADDIRRGLKITKVAKSKRERTFPLPKPKKPYEAQHQTFDLTPKPPRDQTWLLIVVSLVIIVLLSAFVASC